MAVISSLLFLCSLALAVTLGSQTRPWSWGPSLLFLGLSLLPALPSLWRGRRPFNPLLLVGWGMLTLWFAGRAWMSPVREFAVADMLLMAAVAGSFLVMQPILESEKAFKVFLGGIAILTIASGIVVFLQIKDPQFTPIYSIRPAQLPSGFFGHYNEGANFLLACVTVLLAASLFSKHPKFVRCLWAAATAAGIISIYYIRSKSGLLSLGVGFLVFFAAALVRADRKKQWFWPTLVGMPVLLAGVLGVVGTAWTKAQQARNYDISILDMMFDIRLRIWGIATSCIFQHPWTGGGSRSFSWESFQFMDIGSYGWGFQKLEMAHNELLQTATDYGLVAVFGLILLFTIIILHAVFGLLNKQHSPENGRNAAIWAVGLAMLASLMMQATFNFSLHLLPGAVIFGVALAFTAFPNLRQREQQKPLLGATVVSAASVIISITLLGFGWKGTRAFQTLAPLYLKSGQRVSEEERLHRLSAAATLWPLSVIEGERAMILHKRANKSLSEGTPSSEIEAAIKAYRAGLALSPFDITLSINLANLLSASGRDDEATGEYERACSIQGEMERSFKSHYHFSNHLTQLAYRQLRNSQGSLAISNFGRARSEFELAVKGRSPTALVPEGASLLDSIDIGTGLSLEQENDVNEALKTYELAATKGSNGGKFHAAKLLNRIGNSWWSERKSGEALGAFLEAQTLLKSMGGLPEGTTEMERNELENQLNQTITFLQEAKIEPVERTKKSSY